MGNDLTISNAQLPAALAAKMGKSKIAENAIAGIGSGSSHPRISIKGARFRIVEDGAESVLPDTSIDVVIVGVNPRLSKTYYAKAWEPDSEPAAPDCFSIGGIRPDPSATNPQDSLCATCPQNAWGSKKNAYGTDIKACSDQKRLAVVAADDPAGTIYLLNVTPAAFKDFNTYIKQLQMRSFPPEYVRTRLSFDTNASFPKLTFGFGGFVDDADIAHIDNILGSSTVTEITGEDADDEAPAAPAAPKPVLVAAKPEPEPKKAASFGKKAEAKPKAEAKTDDGTMSMEDELAALLGGVDDDS